MSEEPGVEPAPRGRAPRARIPRGVWALGFVSMLMDTSSEMIHGLLPVFLVSVLGASTLAVGLIEGVAEATASITKIFSGTLSDYLGRRKLPTTIGYALAAATKPLFALAPSVGWVFTARFLDRIGKGIRGAPRDALVGELAPPALRGASYGLRQSLDTVGAVAGPLLAILLMKLTGDAFRLVFWIAAAPALLSVAILVIKVREPERALAVGATRAPLSVHALRGLGSAYWRLVGVAGLLAVARFSEAFLVLRAENVGLPLALVPLVLVGMNLAYASSAYPAGRLSDRIGRHRLLAMGFVLLLAAHAVLAAATGILAVGAGVLLWGLHMGTTQGLFAALVADASPPDRRGTAFGAFHLVSGVATLAGSVLAGWLWGYVGPPAAFAAGAGFTILSLAGLAGARRTPSLPGRNGPRP